MINDFIHKEHGQALLEMALVLPLFLLLMLGVLEMGRIGYAYVTVNNAARAGARVASVGGSDLAIKSAVNHAVSLNPPSLSIEISPPENQRQTGQEVTVKVSYDVELIMPVIEEIFPNPFTVAAGLTMRLE